MGSQPLRQYSKSMEKKERNLVEDGDKKSVYMPSSAEQQSELFE